MKDQARPLCELSHDAASVFGPWSCCAQWPGAIHHPDELSAADVEWLSATVPGTVASALDASGKWDFEAPVDIDASDWWYRTSFVGVDHNATDNKTADDKSSAWLRFEGLATIAEVWLNGRRILATDNMFRSYRVAVSSDLREDNELVVCFRSLSEALKKKRPRPRWKTNLVAQQQLRWHRTSLLGRIPGWAPVAPTVGPWRSVRLETSPVVLDELRLTTRVEGTTGIVSVTARIETHAKPTSVHLRVGDQDALLEVQDGVIDGELRFENAPLWWPHTHGSPERWPCEIVVETSDAEIVAHRAMIGFRKLATSSDGFGVKVNGVPIYCRGACWTVSDLLSPTANEASLRHDLQLARDAGVNMLRVGGTMTYESDRFYELCDEFGILVWQDFMFANMDYPVDDSEFDANITSEAREQVARLAAHPSVAIFCGNSEIEQQAAMLGMPRELWRNAWFGERLPAIVAELHPNAIYVPSTPTGGALPFHTREGVTHYYGVGAYLRPIAELRSAAVRFTSECLGFSNVPEPSTCVELFDGANPVTHDPRWKRRVPRDTGPGWDFEDVREHYLRELYGVDPVTLRSFQMNRYLQLSGLASGEMMSRVFAEWRSTHTVNRGALVWFYKDLWPGAGWGVVDSRGLPKAAYYFLKRAWRTHQLTMIDEGINGLDLHLTNETPHERSGHLEVTLLKEPNVVVARYEIDVTVDARSQQRHTVDAILGRFYDCNYAYRFGPPHHDVVIATWYDDQRQVLSEAMHFIHRRDPQQKGGAKLDAIAERLSNTAVRLTLHANAFLHGVRVDAEGWLADDNYFHLPPERVKTIILRPLRETSKVFRATVDALNFDAGVSVSEGAR
jgi:beta-mannosidase